MKVFRITYKVKGNQYDDVVFAKRLRNAQQKLAVKHKCVLQAVKILDSVVIEEK